MRWGRKAVDQVTHLIAGLPKGGGDSQLHGNTVVLGPRLREATMLYAYSLYAVATDIFGISSSSAPITVYK